MYHCNACFYLINIADVIFYYMEKVRQDSISKILEEKKIFSEFVLCTDDETVFDMDLSKVYDIWKLPLAEKEVSFRFHNIQKIYKQMTDYWLARNYLDSVINGVPDLIWYKTKEGIHLKVNESLPRGWMSAKNQKKKSCAKERPV